MHALHILSIQGLKNVPSEIFNGAIFIESLIFLLLSICPENSTLVQVFNNIGLIYTFISLTPLILDLEHIAFPPLGYLFQCWITLSSPTL